MAQVIVGGANVFNALAYGEPSTSTLNYLQEQFNTGMSRLSDAGQEMFARGKEIYEQFVSSEAIRQAKAALSVVRNAFQRDVIFELREIEEFQQAKPVMQRWIMTAPALRKLYLQQRCDGYAGTYVDMEPGATGEDHYDWRRVHHGLAVEVPGEDGEESDYKVTWYLDELRPGEEELTLEQKVDILTAWDFISNHLKTSEVDPTSPTGGLL